MPAKKTFPMLLKAANGKVMEWEIWVVELASNGYGRIHVRFGYRGGEKQETQDIVSAGKNAGKKNATTPYAQACAEAESKWNKQKDRKGYGLTAEESAQIRGASPMLAQVYEKQSRRIEWGKAFAQPKLDGFRCLAHIGRDRSVKLLSRENQPLTALVDLRDEIAELVKTLSVPGADIGEEGLALDGELYCHDMSLNQISSACKKKSALTDRIAFHVYDAMLGKADFETRSLFVKDVTEAAASDRMVRVPTVKVRSETELMVAQQDFLGQQYEGAMLRHGSAPYEAGKRSSALLKVKTFQDAEFVVTDFKMGRGKYAEVPVFTCETADGHAFDVTAPGTMEEKKALGAAAKDKVGKKLTVKYQYFTKTDEPVPFLPVAVRFRD